VSWRFEDLSGCPVVFVDHAVETLSAPYRGVHRDDDGWVVVGRQLFPALMRTVLIEVVHVLADPGSLHVRQAIA
jgi:hypothetical protein